MSPEVRKGVDLPFYSMLAIVLIAVVTMTLLMLRLSDLVVAAIEGRWGTSTAVLIAWAVACWFVLRSVVFSIDAPPKVEQPTQGQSLWWRPCDRFPGATIALTPSGVRYKVRPLMFKIGGMEAWEITRESERGRRQWIHSGTKDEAQKLCEQCEESEVAA